MLDYYIHPILGFQWIGSTPLPIERKYSKKRKRDNEAFRHKI